MVGRKSLEIDAPQWFLCSKIILNIVSLKRVENNVIVTYNYLCAHGEKTNEFPLCYDHFQTAHRPTSSDCSSNSFDEHSYVDWNLDYSSASNLTVSFS